MNLESGSRFLRGLCRLRFSPIERHDLLKSWFVISLAFSLAMGGSAGLDMKFLVLMIVAAVTVGTGFLLHELAHKAVAVHYGLWAEYRAFDNMLLLSLALSLFGFLFAAPGAVFITSRTPDMWHVPPDKNGKISAAGPLVNFALAAGFIGLGLALPVLKTFALFGAQINIWLGLFNMIPIFNFDGSKIWPWSKAVYLGMVIVGAGMMLLVSRMGAALA